jgi:lactate dehydrogenase-like 2-hydroxyacid dehydrogenase
MACAGLSAATALTRVTGITPQLKPERRLALTSPKPHLLMPGAYPEADMLDLNQHYTVHRLWEAPDRAAYLAQHGPQIRAVATRGDLGAAPDLLAALPALELVACYGVGVDAIALDVCRQRGIRVSNTPDVLNGDVADLAVALALATLRGVALGDRHVRSGAWAKQGSLPPATRLFGQRVGIAGFGRIGQTIAKRLAGFDCELAYFSRNAVAGSALRHFTSLEALAQWCAVLIVILPGGEATRGIVSAQVLKALGPEGWLVNVSRGSTVDEEALLQALHTRSIAGAGLDVFLNEPRVDPRFFDLPNVVLQPHQGSGTVQTRKAMGELVRQNLHAHFAGQALVTPVA